MNNTLTCKAKWEAVWATAYLPAIKKPVPDVQRQFETYLPRSNALSFIEIGCAPGSWMGYFYKQFGYRVSGLEYAELAAETTKVNMDLLGIEANIIVADFLTFDSKQAKYDIVFSAGFLEHFRNISVVAERLCSLSHKYVVTIVPNLRGVNGCVSKTIRPKVFAEHVTIDTAQLEAAHAQFGVRTLFCNYVGGVRFLLPAEGNAFFAAHKHFARVLNTPVCLFNRLSDLSQKFGAWTPRSWLFSDSVLYIGEKQTRLLTDAG